MFFSGFLFILTHISLDLLSLCSAKALHRVRWKTEWSFDSKFFVMNIRTKNYQNLIIGFQVTVKNVGDVFLRHSVVIFTFYTVTCWCHCS